VAIIPLKPVVFLAICVFSVVTVVYTLNFFWWNNLAPKTYLARISLTQDDTLFLEGIILIAFGLLLILGRGGINIWSLRVALLSALADFFYGRKGRGSLGPSETLRRDSWKPSGFVLPGLILILAGIILVALYFL